MSNLDRRGLRLASALVAAGVALGVAPPAQADDNAPLTLTDAQADELAKHAQVDVYGEGQAYDPLKIGGHPNDTAPSDGTGTEGQSSLDDAPAKLTARSAMEGVQGMAATIPAGGAGGDYFALHSLGTVQRRSADGKQLWMRDTTSLYADWQVTPVRWYQPEAFPAKIVMGYNAVSPFTPASEDGYATGDLTGDGVDDVVFTATAGVNPYRPFTSPGSTLPNGTFVTVLDGKTGKTLWSKLYAGAYNIKLVGKTLVVADSPFFNVNSPADSKTTLGGIRFSYADGKLTPAETWTYDAGTYTGVAWGSLEPLGNGLLAASWNQYRRYTADLTPSGHTLVFDTKDGSVTWSSTGRLYSRQLHLDPARGRLVALEQSDPNEGVQYEIASYSPADGTRTTLDTRINALPLAMVVGDVQGDAKPEYTVSESTLDSSTALFMNANSVRALNGDTAGLLWSRTIKRDPASGGDSGAAWGLQAVDGKIVASYMDDRGSTTADNRGAGRYARLAVLAGNNGAVKWEKRGLVASMLWAQPVRRDGGWHLRTVDTNQNVHLYNSGSGRQDDLLPLQGQVFAAASTDINGDKKQDLVVGGQSDGLFAFDGPSLVAGTPKRLWTATLPGQIHQIAVADTATAVVDARTGKVAATIDGGGRFVRTVAAADLDGDRRAEIIVPTDKVRVYQGGGSRRWEYAAPASAGSAVFSDVSTADGRVYAQYQTRGISPITPNPVGGVALNGKDGSVAWSFTPQPGTGTDGKLYGAPLRAGTFASPGIPYADGHAVVYTYDTRRDGTWTTVVQIRDGRTGELLHEAPVGELWNWFTGPEGLVAGSNSKMYTFAAGGRDYSTSFTGDTRTGGFAAGPGGRRVLLAGGVQFITAYDPSVLTAGVSAAFVPGPVILGAQEFFAGDLDGDGVDEVVSLNFDDYGTDRTFALTGGGFSQPFTAARRLVTLTIDAG